MENNHQFSARQEAVVKAYVDSLLPPLRNINENNMNGAPQIDTDNLNHFDSKDESVRRYWEYRLSEDPDFIKTVAITVLQKITVFDRISFLLLLYIMDTRIGTSILFNCYSIKSFKRFADYSEYDRTNVLLQKLQYSSWSIQRKIFQSFKQVFLGIAYTYHTTSATYKNPFWEAMGYRGSPMDWKSEVSDQERVGKAMQEQSPIIRALNDSQERISQQISSLSPCEPHKKDCAILKFDCDIVIVGSGSGGCVAANVLSKAGYSVIVLEQGIYLSPQNITQHEIHALDQQYIQSGLLQNASGTVMILAGNALGGGTSINWSCCLPLPSYVRDEWIHKHRLHETFATPEYDASLQATLHKLGSTYNGQNAPKPTLPHNAMNKKLQQGCTALGYQWTETGQNMRDPFDDTAGYVGMGDRYGNKNGGINSFLIDAVQCGARIFHQCHVTKICRTLTIFGQLRATGVECQITCCDGLMRTMVVEARRRVIVAAGALHSPCLLRQSGLRNYHIGKHLRLHPVAAAIGFYKCNEPIDSILGAPMTTVCNEFAKGPQHNGYGAKIECPCSYPGLLAAGSSWISPRVCKERLFRYRNAVPLICLQRDSGDGGSVRHSLDGKSLVIDYKINHNDRKSMLQSLQGSTRILVASGADEVATGHICDSGYVVNSRSNSQKDISNETTLQCYLSSIARRGMKDHEIGFFSAHQMGTCRMGASSKEGVVDTNGETWECDDLFIMDSSVFPTASGSNPMVTVLTLAHLLSTRLCKLLKLQDNMNAALDQKQQYTEDDAHARTLFELRKKARRRTAITSFGGIWGLLTAPVIIAAILGCLRRKWNFF